MYPRRDKGLFLQNLPHFSALLMSETNFQKNNVVGNQNYAQINTNYISTNCLDENWSLYIPGCNLTTLKSEKFCKMHF